MKIELPQSTPVVSSDGRIDPLWLERLQQVVGFVNLFSEVDVPSLTNGQVLIWNAALKKFLPGAN